MNKLIRMNFAVLTASVLLLFLQPAFAVEQARARYGAETFKVENVIVYDEPGRFCGWPANNGIWNWGNEILVGFHLCYYKESANRHSFDRSKPRERVQARSLDGGRTWTLEKPDAFRDFYTGKKKPVVFNGKIDFTNPDFAMTCRGERFYFSYDRGKTWQGPYRLPRFGQKAVMARTDYIINGKDSCLLFLTATKTNDKEGRPFCARMTNGGGNIEFISWIAPEPKGYSIMPSTVRISKDKLVSAIRRYERGDINWGWIEVYVSNDGGQSWHFQSEAASCGAHGGNPPSMVRLKDGRLVVTYGYRSKPQGIRAKISDDEGKSWSDVIYLREDGRTWDIGYTRTVVRPDGRCVTIYYYTTEKNPEQHIAATIWDPNNVR